MRHLIGHSEEGKSMWQNQEVLEYEVIFVIKNRWIFIEGGKGTPGRKRV